MGQEQDARTWIQMALHYWSIIDAFGLILLGTGWSLLLLPFTLYTTAENGWKNRKSLHYNFSRPRRTGIFLSQIR